MSEVANHSEFIEELAEVFETEADEMKAEYQLNEENWDSMAIISTIALVDEHFEKMVDAKKLGKCQKLGDLFVLVETAGNA